MSVITPEHKALIKRQGLLGTTYDGDTMYIEVEVRPQTGVFQTVHHTEVIAPNQITISGHTFYEGSNRSDCDTAGQIMDTLLELDPDKLAPGLTGLDIALLHAIWDAYHLNTLNAGCSHQTVVWEDSLYGRRPSLTLTEPCPETGYKYGNGWLVEEVDEIVIRNLRETANRLDGTNGYRPGKRSRSAW